jgi:hypothetical protein
MNDATRRSYRKNFRKLNGHKAYGVFDRHRLPKAETRYVHLLDAMCGSVCGSEPEADPQTAQNA